MRLLWAFLSAVAAFFLVMIVAVVVGLMLTALLSGVFPRLLEAEPASRPVLRILYYLYMAVAIGSGLVFSLKTYLRELSAQPDAEAGARGEVKS